MTDIEVRMCGSATLLVAQSETAQRWFKDRCPDDLRYAFEFRRYGDTPFGWFNRISDADMQRLGLLFDQQRFTVQIQGAVQG